ncbi:MAG: hypothetical protein NCW75_14035 [Phycisphaera sp.]|nr:MAG: hypothetical protein NCW75_14035 [Phycisphaera sp.]
MTTMTPGFGEARPVLDVAIVGLLACGGIFLLALAVSQGRLEHAVYLLIGMLFLGGVGTVVAGAVRARQWSRETEREVEHLERIEDVGTFLVDTAGSTTPFRATINGMAQAGRHGRPIHGDDWVGVMEDQLDRLAGPARWLSGSCVLIGVFGTALGAMQSLSGLSAYASSADVGSGPKMFEELLGFGGPIASLSLAYGSTVLGVLASIVLNALAAAVQASGRAYVAHSRELLANYIVPAICASGAEGSKKDGQP